MERQPIPNIFVVKSAETIHKVSHNSVRAIEKRNFDGLDEEYQEMNDYVLMMNHDHYVEKQPSPERDAVLGKIKKELGRRALEY